MKKTSLFKHSIISNAMGVSLSLTIAFTSVSLNAASLPAGVVVDANTSAHQQAAIRAAFSAPLSMAGTRRLDPAFLTLAGARVTGLDRCDGDLGLTITNAFEDGTLKKIYENFEEILSAVTSTGGLMYLGSLYIQKSNPGLYNLLTNGVNIGMDDFFNGIASCESILTAASTYIPEDIMSSGITTTENAIKTAEEKGYDLSQIDIVDFMSANPSGDVTPETINDEGQKWYTENGVLAMVGGINASQEVVSFVKAASAKGYCILRGIDEDDCNAEGTHAAANTFASDIVDHPLFEIMFGDEEDDYMKNIQSLATKIYGEVMYTSCDGCSATNSYGVGIQRFFESQVAEIASLISVRVGSNLDTMSADNIDEMSAPNAIIVTMPYIKSIKMYEDRPSTQEIMINALATEVAYHRVLYISNLFDQVFRAMLTDEKTIAAKWQGQYTKLIRQNREQFDMFVKKELSVGFKPGRYARMILAMSDGEGNIDSIINSQVISR